LPLISKTYKKNKIPLAKNAKDKYSFINFQNLLNQNFLNKFLITKLVFLLFIITNLGLKSQETNPQSILSQNDQSNINEEAFYFDAVVFYS
jgi:hypothetical protein